MSDALHTLGSVLLILMVPPATLFPILYGLRSPWRSTAVGRGLMLSSVGMALLVDFAVIFNVLGVDAPRWLRAAIFAWICGSLYYQLVNLLRVQQRVRDERSGQT